MKSPARSGLRTQRRQLKKGSDDDLADHSIVLGDILTILFSFFVLMVTLKEYSLLNSKPVSGEVAHPTEVGKNVAAVSPLNMDEKQSLVLFLDENEVSDFIQLNQISEVAIDAVGQPHGTLVVEICTRTRMNNPWKFTANRAAQIKLALQRREISTEQLGYRILGSHCESLPPGSTATSVLAFRYQKTNI